MYFNIVGHQNAHMLNAIFKLNMYMINQELVYELKLPSFKDIVLPTFKAVNDDDKSINYLIKTQKCKHILIGNWSTKDIASKKGKLDKN
jgi:hypothetical protein